MATPDWHRFDDRDAMAQAAADHILALVERVLADRDRGVLAFAGGKTPIPIFSLLAASTQVEWSRVTILPADDRLVAHDDVLSNFGLIQAAFAGTGATFVSLTPDRVPAGEDGAVFARAAIADLQWPLDLLWLGMGRDGHTGSILPGPNFETALSPAQSERVIAVLPDPLPAEAPVERVTLTLTGMLPSRNVLLTLTGPGKLSVLERAIADGAASRTAVGRVLSALPVPAAICWAA